MNCVFCCFTKPAPVTHPINNTNTIIEEDFLKKTVDQKSRTSTQRRLPKTINTELHHDIEMINIGRDLESGIEYLGQVRNEEINYLKQTPSQVQLTLYRKPRSMTTKMHNRHLLRDENNLVEDVQVNNFNVSIGCSPEYQLVFSVNKCFEDLITRGDYDKIVKFGENMNEEFSKQVCLAVKTYEQYEHLVERFKDRKMTVHFFLYGDFKIVRKIIAKSHTYGVRDYVCGGNLESAIILAFKRDYHVRAMHLFVIRRDVTAELDKQFERSGENTSFDTFLKEFFFDLAPWKNSEPLRRFLTFHAEQFEHSHPNVYAAFCRSLIHCLRQKIGVSLGARKFLIDLIGQSSVTLTPRTFVDGFLRDASDISRSNFVAYAWKEAIQESLSEEYGKGSERLWRLMKRGNPNKFSGKYPLSDEVLANTLEHFPTKNELEGTWIKDNVSSFLKDLEKLSNTTIFPTVLFRLIIDYANPKPTCLDIGYRGMECESNGDENYYEDNDNDFENHGDDCGDENDDDDNEDYYGNELNMQP